MTPSRLLIGLLAASVTSLSACDLPQSYAQSPAAEQAAPTTSGIRVSGYGRVGVSHRF
ncbi:hypothetical protein [Pseudophaeobacter flagellatus]|uniref:hypothetical protein n=1 Tax=Pseudophaeobacter flagellatus TaxID=2899119 RepID=UPI001E5E5E14|nr:hypothetical protein [Pseudophaeobacter flagellatus]MCD9148221.1 hypothetical protein [Pseudophaeobacter flagellatus]